MLTSVPDTSAAGAVTPQKSRLASVSSVLQSLPLYNELPNSSIVLNLIRPGPLPASVCS